MSNLVKFYKDKNGRWRWNLTAPNGRKIAREAEGDGYDSERDARRGFEAAYRREYGEVVEKLTPPGVHDGPKPGGGEGTFGATVRKVE